MCKKIARKSKTHAGVNQALNEDHIWGIYREELLFHAGDDIFGLILKGQSIQVGVSRKVGCQICQIRQICWKKLKRHNWTNSFL